MNLSAPADGSAHDPEEANVVVVIEQRTRVMAKDKEVGALNITIRLSSVC